MKQLIARLRYWPRCRPAAAVLGAVLVSATLGACSTVEKAWSSTKETVGGLFSGDDKPEASGAAANETPPNLSSVPTTAPTPPSSQQARDTATEGLVADREKAQYTEQGGRQEPVTVRPLAAGAATTGSRTGGPPVPDAAPTTAVTRLETPAPAAPVPPRTTALAERLGAAPPPPPPAEGSSTPAPAAPASPVALQTAAQGAPSAPIPTRPLVPVTDNYGADTVVIDGSGVRGGQAVIGNLQVAAVPRASFDPGSSSVSSEVAVVAFAAGSSSLSAAAKAELANVAALRAQVDGAIRIVGKGDQATARANAVARELRRLGVPAGRVYTGGADGATLVNEAEIYLDY